MARPSATAAAIVAIAASALVPALADAAPSNGTTGNWTLVGGSASASAMASSGDVVYMGGSFTGIGRRAQGVAAFDTTSGVVASSTADLTAAGTPAVRVVAEAPDGGVYVAGSFTAVGGVPQAALVHFSPDAQADGTYKVDRTFRPQLVGQVDDIAVGADGTVYAAGSFTSAGGQARTGLAALDGTTGAVKPWSPTVSGGDVRDIQLGSAGAYIAGSFQSVGGQTRTGVALVSLASGAVNQAWNPAPNGAVSSLAVAGSTVFMAGDFSQVGGTARPSLAAVSAAGAGGVIQGWNPAPDGTATTVTARGSTVYVGGTFSNVGGAARTNLAALGATSGAATSWDAGLTTESVPKAILATDTRVYLGFAGIGLSQLSVGGEARCGLAAVDAGTGAVDQSWDPELFSVAGLCGGIDGVASLALVGTRLWAGGQFDSANVRSRAGLAALDVQTDAPTAWAPVADATHPAGVTDVRSLAVSPDGATVYIGGQFADVNGVARTNAAAVTASGTANQPANVTAWDPSPNGRVNVLRLSPSGVRVYLGGAFTKLRATTRPYLAWSAATDGAPSTWAPSPDGVVSDLAVAADGRVFAAGVFNNAGGQARRAVAALDPTTGDATAWTAGMSASSSQVDSVALAGGVVYIGGLFNETVGGAPRASVAALDATTGVATSWAPAVGPTTARVRRVSVGPDGTVYLLGTNIQTVGGAPRQGAASVDAAGVVTGWNPPGVGQFASPPPVQFLGGRVVVGGDFERAGGRFQAGFGIFGTAVAPAAGAPPTLRYTAPLHVGSSLSCDPGTYTGSAPFTSSFEWLRDGQPTGTTGAGYTTGPLDSDHDLSCRETVYNAAGTATQTSPAARVQPVAPELVEPPTVGGEPWAGGTARCSTGIWRNGPTSYAYRWLLDGSAVAGATGSDYPLATGDLGHTIACEVTAGNAAGQSVAGSAPVTIGLAPPRNLSSPLISGQPQVGVQVGCDPGTWTGASGFSYSWLRDGVAVPDATTNRFQLTSRDLGRTVVCRVRASGPGGTTLADSAGIHVQPLPHSQGSRKRDDGDGSSRKRPTLDLRQVRVAKDGTLLLKVAVPGAGTLSVEARASAPLLVGRTKAKPRAGRVVTLHLEPGKAARRAIRKAGRRGLKVRFTVRFKPKGGGKQRIDRATVRLRARASASTANFTTSSLLGY